MELEYLNMLYYHELFKLKLLLSDEMIILLTDREY